MTQRVLVDANVISSRTLGDWLFHFQRSNDGVFSLFWSRDIQAEAIRAMRKRNPNVSGKVIEARFKMMEDIIDEIVTFPDGDYGFTGRDKGDYHVHATAVYGEADYLLTSNKTSDFTDDPDSEPYEIITPDDFFVLIADSDPTGFVEVTKDQFDYYSANADRFTGSMRDKLEDAGCPVFAGRVKAALSQIAQNG